MATRLAVLYGGCPRESDLVAYWHEKARALSAAGKVRRAGLLATQGIRGGANQRVLTRIKETGEIFLAYADEPWVLAGANFHISFVGLDDGSDSVRTPDGHTVADTNPAPTSAHSLTTPLRLLSIPAFSVLSFTQARPKFGRAPL